MVNRDQSVREQAAMLEETLWVSEHQDCLRTWQLQHRNPIKQQHRPLWPKAFIKSYRFFCADNKAKRLRTVHVCLESDHFHVFFLATHFWGDFYRKKMERCIFGCWQLRLVRKNASAFIGLIYSSRMPEFALQLAATLQLASIDCCAQEFVDAWCPERERDSKIAKLKDTSAWRRHQPFAILASILWVK